MSANTEYAILSRMRPPLARLIPWLGLLVLGLAVTLGVLRGGACAAIGIAGGILLYGATAFVEERFSNLDKPLTIFVFAFLAYAAALSPLSLTPDVSWHQTAQLATIMLPLLLLSSPAIRARVAKPEVLRFWPWLLLLGAAAIALVLLQVHQMRANESILTKYNRGLSYALLFCWPLMAMLWQQQKRGMAFIILLSLLPALYLTHSRATQVMTVLALLVWVAAYWVPTVTRRGLGLLLLLFLGWPFMAQYVFSYHSDWLQALPDSWHHRVEIWDFMSYRIMEHPWLGWGIGSSHELSPALPHGELYRFAHDKVAHPHNAMTQLWVELGLPGLALGVGFAFLMLRHAGNLPRNTVPFALGGWLSAIGLSLVAYDLWTDSLLATFALSAFAFALCREMPQKGN